MLQASNDTITGYKTGFTGSMLMLMTYPCAISEYGLPFPVGMKDMVYNRLLGLAWRAELSRSIIT